MTEPLAATDGDPEIRSYLDWADVGRASVGAYVKGLIGVLFVFFVLAGIGVFPVTIIDPQYKDSLMGSDIALLAAFVIPFFGIPFIVGRVHRRPGWSVALPRPRLEAWNLTTGFVVSTVVGVLTLAVAGALDVIELETASIDWREFLPVALVGTVGIFIQASSEEMLFRGYLAQFVAHVTKAPFFIIGVPALLFAIPHIANVAHLGGDAWVLLPYLMPGLLYGWAAWRTGSLWISIGLHWSNNLSNLLIAGPKDDVLQTVAPLEFATPDLATTTAVLALQTLVTVVLLASLIRRREARSGHPADRR